MIRFPTKKFLHIYCYRRTLDLQIYTRWRSFDQFDRLYLGSGYRHGARLTSQFPMDDAAGSYNVASHLPVDGVVTVATVTVHLVHAGRRLANGLLQGKHLY